MALRAAACAAHGAAGADRTTGQGVIMGVIMMGVITGGARRMSLAHWRRI